MDVFTNAFGRLATSQWLVAVDAMLPVLLSVICFIAEILLGAK